MEAVQEEGEPIRRPAATRDQPVVEHEDRNDGVGAPGRRRESGMVVQAEIPREENDQPVDETETSTLGEAARGRPLVRLR